MNPTSRYGLIVLLVLLLGAPVTTAGPAQTVQAFGAKVDQKVRPLLEAAFGQVEFVRIRSGGPSTIASGVSFDLVYRASKDPPPQPELEARLREILKKLNAEPLLAVAAGGVVSVTFTDLEIDGVEAAGRLMVNGREILFGLTID